MVETIECINTGIIFIKIAGKILADQAIFNEFIAELAFLKPREII